MTALALGEAFNRLQAALEPFAIEVGPEVLDVWRDRERFGNDPIPAGALENLAAAAVRLLGERRAAAGAE